MKLGIKLFCLLLFALSAHVSLAQESKAESNSKSTNPYRVDVDMARHQLTVYKADAEVKKIHISGGGDYNYTYYTYDKIPVKHRHHNGKRYKRGKKHKHHGYAHTPRGRFKLHHGRRKWVESSLNIGFLYCPVYFSGGTAIHGAKSVPKHHVSHGCVRIPIRETHWFYDTIPEETPVHVHD